MRQRCARGVAHAALFGSRPRSDERPDSDIMIEIDPEAHVGVWEYLGLKDTSPVCSMGASMWSIARA